jgi:hypothetical protein
MNLTNLGGTSTFAGQDEIRWLEQLKLVLPQQTFPTRQSKHQPEFIQPITINSIQEHLPHHPKPQINSSDRRIPSLHKRVKPPPGQTG